MIDSKNNTPDDPNDDEVHPMGDPPEGYTDVQFVRTFTVTRRVKEANKTEAVKLVRAELGDLSGQQAMNLLLPGVGVGAFTVSVGGWRLDEVNGDEPAAICEGCNLVMFEDHEYRTCSGDDGVDLCLACFQGGIDSGDISTYEPDTDDEDEDDESMSEGTGGIGGDWQPERELPPGDDR